MNQPVSPCKRCSSRAVGCHSTCKKYMIYKSLLARYKLAAQLEYDETCFVFSTKSALRKVAK